MLCKVSVLKIIEIKRSRYRQGKNSSRGKIFVSSAQLSNRLWHSRGVSFNPLNAELNPICHLLALLGSHHILHISRIRVMCTGVLSRGQICRGVRFTTQLRLPQRLRTCRSITLSRLVSLANRQQTYGLTI